MADHDYTITTKPGKRGFFYVHRGDERFKIPKRTGLDPNDIEDVKFSPPVFIMEGSIIQFMNLDYMVKQLDTDNVNIPDQWRTFIKTDPTHRIVQWNTYAELPGYILAVKYTRFTVVYSCYARFSAGDTDLEVYKYTSDYDSGRSSEYFTDPKMYHILPPSNDHFRDIFIGDIHTDSVFAINSVAESRLDFQATNDSIWIPGSGFPFIPGNTFVSGPYDFPDRIKRMLNMSKYDIDESKALKLEQLDQF
jgi:hypothetical protein